MKTLNEMFLGTFSSLVKCLVAYQMTCLGQCKEDLWFMLVLAINDITMN